MGKNSLFRRLAAALAVFHLLMVAQVPLANAAMIGTAEVLTAQQQQVDRQQLLSMLEDQGVQKKLEAMGVERTQVEARINSLTNAELAQFNQQLQESPAGSGVVGIIVLFLVIFIITDMLCATNIFSFVKCINR
ncbi:PA2779 family protein [Pseudomonas benzenivorans]|uniref:PA2779 family protein n=1 Tax=Pseudomonas benzenivorans TaxID=556533 RepID=A0ABZ0PQJ8_9PSED|nr:PA2779 family protein [Pseudomonas benzenivorans]WPC03423.1 PA2779 family protein [Pseudomonas benzenivorans]